MGKEIVNQVQEAQRVLYRINPRRNMPRHILIKLSKINYKEKILKAAREKHRGALKKNVVCNGMLMGTKDFKLKQKQHRGKSAQSRVKQS